MLDFMKELKNESRKKIKINFMIFSQVWSTPCSKASSC